MRSDLYGFLATEPNAEVAAVHQKAMPVCLVTADELDVGCGTRRRRCSGRWGWSAGGTNSRSDNVAD